MRQKHDSAPASPLRRLLPLGLLAAAVVNALAGDPPDYKPLRGDWVPVAAELGGQAMPDAVLKKIRMTLGDGTYEVSVGGQPDTGTFEIDATTTPRSMVIRGTAGPNQGRTFPAIYELKGTALRICYNLAGEPRPKEFKTTAGTKLYLVTYQRK